TTGGSEPVQYKPVESDKRYPLDPNHTHFLLVKGRKTTEFGYGVDLEFRHKLQNCISETETDDYRMDIQNVTILIEGGLSSCKFMLEQLKSGIPVVVVKGTGKASDWMAYAYEHSREDKAKPNLDT
ncbi:TMP2L-like protein, partial [Mya arenaria]